MIMRFNDAAGRVLHGLIKDAAGDIVIRLDEAGFITQASENASELGFDLSSLLLLPHIADLAREDYAGEVLKFVKGVYSDQPPQGWLEFPLKDWSRPSHGELAPEVPPGQRWYAFSIRAMASEDDASQEMLGLLRSVQHKKSLEGEINARALTDPLTGLANRHAFCARLRNNLDEANNHAVAVFAIDRLRAIFMQYGQRTADEIQWGFAKFLEAMTASEQELAMLDGERFGVLLKGLTVRQARDWTEDVLQTFAALAVDSSSRALQLTASAGLARAEMSVDWTLQQAELGLVMARAGGGMQIGICGQPVRPVLSPKPSRQTSMRRANGQTR